MCVPLVYVSVKDCWRRLVPWTGGAHAKREGTDKVHRYFFKGMWPFFLPTPYLYFPFQWRGKWAAMRALNTKSSPLLYTSSHCIPIWNRVWNLGHTQWTRIIRGAVGNAPGRKKKNFKISPAMVLQGGWRAREGVYFYTVKIDRTEHNLLNTPLLGRRS